ncbi:MAG: DUF2911 domain-containing protein [Gemmatimonadetes bacterium]|nr:DUF2911 domain-containing protein [Gemmatimonadota bacterium]
MKRSALGLLAVLALSAPAVQGQSATCIFRGAPDALAERPSPLDSVEIRLGGAAAKLCYGRPATAGRTVVGGQDPFGVPWRFGANEPTTLHVPFEASVGGVALSPGSYSLYAIPEARSWTIVVNGSTNRWGIPINPEVRQSDIGSFVVQVATTDAPVERLTFRFDSSAESSGILVFEWERTTFEIPISRR